MSSRNLKLQWNKFIPHTPTLTQTLFLERTELEVLYGGAAGGGKSDALLMAALQYITRPKYAALILRRTYADLSLPDAIMNRAHSWLQNTKARWKDTEKTWIFPSKATLTFGYLQSENDKYRYQSSAFQFIAFDELTQFTESQYTYLFSRLRKQEDSDIPLRMRSGSNPGGIGHEWVKQRFFIEQNSDRFFQSAKLKDNPHINRDEYIKSLNNLDPYTREQLLNGDWRAQKPGRKFDRNWFRVIDILPAELFAFGQWVRFWDLAGTEPRNGSDPDYTVGALMCEYRRQFYLVNIARFRKTPAESEKEIKLISEKDRANYKRYRIRIEQEGGSAGKYTEDHFVRNVLPGFSVQFKKPPGSKELRADPYSSMAANHNVYMLRAAWNREYLDELESFPGGAHDDQVDASDGAFNELVSTPMLSHESMVHKPTEKYSSLASNW